MELIIALILIVVWIGILASMKNKDDEQKDDKYKKVLKTISGMEHEKKFINENNPQAILYDDKTKNIFLVNENTKIENIYYRDIIQVEITEDKDSITKISRGSQLAGTIIGGLALGGTGAIIGGLSGTKQHTEKIKELGIRLIVNDTNNPVREFQFYEFIIPAKKESDRYKQSYKTVYEWFKLIEVLIHQADKEDNQKLNSVN